jgi:hypothetical protein
MTCVWLYMIRRQRIMIKLFRDSKVNYKAGCVTGIYYGNTGMKTARNCRGEKYDVCLC